jgi:hypothetical protein
MNLDYCNIHDRCESTNIPAQYSITKYKCVVLWNDLHGNELLEGFGLEFSVPVEGDDKGMLSSS